MPCRLPLRVTTRIMGRQLSAQISSYMFTICYLFVQDSGKSFVVYLPPLY